MVKTSEEYSALQHETRGTKLRLCVLLMLPFSLLWIVVLHPDILIVLSLWRTRSENNEVETTLGYRDITPCKQLKYTPCYDDFQCARLDVPLNWNANDRDAGPRVAIAIVKLPAKVPVTDERYGGAILMNPGGPGESGVHQVLSGGKHIQTIVDSPTSPAEASPGVYFDIISFDPRGVNNTMPRLKCFRDAFNQQAWLLKFPDYGLLWDSESVLGLEWARASAMGASCSRQWEEEDMVRYVNTAQVVEDMVEIIERHGEWREEEARKILGRGHCHEGSSKSEGREEDAERTRWKKGEEKIMFWGISYGSVLGQTFASMQPERVSRLVIDGVLDPDDYYSGSWLLNLQNSDMIITKFCDYCYAAGPEKCPLYTGHSGADIEVRLENIMMNLKTNPIPVPALGTRGPEVVTYGDALLQMLTAMYFPFAWAEYFFDVLVELEARNGTRIAYQKQAVQKAEVVSETCKKAGPFSDTCVSSTYISGMGPNQAVSCMDAGGASNFTREDFKEYLATLKKQSKWISTSWSRNKLACVGYTVQPAWKFDGPISGNTPHPMLIVGNTHDTVTPIGNAYRVSTLFPGSVVLQQEAQGHSSYSNPSICTGKVLREYFHAGKLPEAGTVCIPEYKPFIGCIHKDEHGECRKLSQEDQKMWDAMVAITDVWP